MPHWFAFVSTTSPPVLEGTEGDPELVRERIFAEAPQGASVRSIHWLSGEDRAALTVEGPNAEQFLDLLQAEGRVQIISAGERKAEMG
jgi:hypothetical protein